MDGCKTCREALSINRNRDDWQRNGRTLSRTMLLLLFCVTLVTKQLEWRLDATNKTSVENIQHVNQQQQQQQDIKKRQAKQNVMDEHVSWDSSRFDDLLNERQMSCWNQWRHQNNSTVMSNEHDIYKKRNVCWKNARLLWSMLVDCTEKSSRN